MLGRTRQRSFWSLCAASLQSESAHRFPRHQYRVLSRRVLDEMRHAVPNVLLVVSHSWRAGQMPLSGANLRSLVRSVMWRFCRCLEPWLEFAALGRTHGRSHRGRTVFYKFRTCYGLGPGVYPWRTASMDQLAGDRASQSCIFVFYAYYGLMGAAIAQTSDSRANVRCRVGGASPT